MDNWRTVDARDPSGLVLAVDFGPGRPGAGFDDLVELVHLPASLLETTPSRDEDFAVDSGEQVRRWVDAVVGAGVPVRAVVGYCAGTAFAEAIAVEVGRNQADMPRLVLLDPEHVGIGIIDYQFGKALATFRGEVDDGLLDDAVDTGRDVLARTDDFERARPHLVALYRNVAEDCFQRAGLGLDFAHQLVTRFNTYLRYLVLASRVEVANPPPGLVVASSTLGPSAYPHVARRDFDVPREGLLSHDGVGRLIAELLGGAA